MSVTIDISDEKLREAEEALDIHDPTQLFLSLLDEKLAQCAVAAGPTSGLKSMTLADALLAAQALPDLSDEEFDDMERHLRETGKLSPPWRA